MGMDSGYFVKETFWPAKTYIAERGIVSSEKIGDFVEEKCSGIYNAFKALGILLNSPPCAFFYNTKIESKQTEIAVGILCNNLETYPEKFEKIELQGKVLTTSVTGYFSDITSAYKVLDAYLKRNNLSTQLVIEEYCSDCIAEMNPYKWETKLHFIIS